MELKDLTHMNFNSVKEYFEQNKEDLYKKAESEMTNILEEYFNTDTINEIDGRTMSAAFRRFDILERYLKNEIWWEEHFNL